MKIADRVVLLNFWATWCEPCRTETPMLVNLGKEYNERGLKIVGIALDTGGTNLIKKFITEYKVDYPILLPIPGSSLSRIDPVPTTILIDSEGRMVKKYVGELPENILREDIEKLTASSSKKTNNGETQFETVKKVEKKCERSANRSNQENRSGTEEKINGLLPAIIKENKGYENTNSRRIKIRFQPHD